MCQIRYHFDRKLLEINTHFVYPFCQPFLLSSPSLETDSKLVISVMTNKNILYGPGIHLE